VLVLVNVGAVPLGHLTADPHVTTLAVPSAVNASVRLYAVPVEGTLLNESVVTFSFKLTAKTFPTEQSSVNVPEDMDGAVFVSLNPV
jgi:hypothetical protein